MNGWPAWDMVGVRIEYPGAVIEGDEDEDENTEDWEVPEGQIALIVGHRYVGQRKNVLTDEWVSYEVAYDSFFIHGTPKEIWNALGRLQAALPEGDCR